MCFFHCCLEDFLLTFNARGHARCLGFDVGGKGYEGPRVSQLSSFDAALRAALLLC